MQLSLSEECALSDFLSTMSATGWSCSDPPSSSSADRVCWSFCVSSKRACCSCKRLRNTKIFGILAVLSLSKNFFKLYEKSFYFFFYLVARRVFKVSWRFFLSFFGERTARRSQLFFCFCFYSFVWIECFFPLMEDDFCFNQDKRINVLALTYWYEELQQVSSFKSLIARHIFSRPIP